MIKYNGKWDIEKDYDILSMVNFNGHNYVSIQYVPKSISIYNTDFWIIA